MRNPNQLSYGQTLDVAAWQQAWRREFRPFKWFIVSCTLVVALTMGTLCAGWFTMLLQGADRETILPELTGATYFTYWHARHTPELAAQAGLIWKGGALGYGAWLLVWSVFPILSFWPTLRRNEVLVAERDPLPLPDPSIRVPPALQDHYDRNRPYLPPTEQCTLITVGKPEQPDRLHDLNLLRMMRVANERTVRELGPLPASGLPVVPKQKAPHLPPSWRRRAAVEVQPDTEVLENESARAHEESDEMKWSQMAAAAALTAGALSACAQTPRPEPKLNPKPTQRYEITMTIADAPGPFASIEGTAQYDTVNYNECGVRNESSGIFHDLTENVSITFAKVSDTQYVAEVYMDRMLDEDYHGRGTCLWKLTDVRAALKATGAEVETEFVPDTSPENMLDGRAVTVYFNKHWYPRDPDSSNTDINFPDFGQKDRSRFGPSVADADLFTVTLTPKEVMQ